MKIFNIEVFGEDADTFMAMDCGVKKDWIKDNTNQQNDELIEEFLKYAVRGNDDECQGCKDKKNGNIAKPNEPTAATAPEQKKAARNGKNGSGKGRADSASGKN